MSRVRGDVHGRTCLSGVCFSSTRCFDLALQNDEGLLKIVPMRGWASAWRNMHVDHTEEAVCVVSGNGDCIGIANQAYMRQAARDAGKELAARRLATAQRISAALRIPRRL